ncbi:MAG TPA: MMPL family transporter [Nannocystaceae bacterium]|nr:MMPL family transporter [Nannocystaceae bacterium]
MSEPAPTFAQRLASRVTAVVERRAGVIVLVFLALVAVFGTFATRLRIDQELRRLLPDTYPSVVGIDRLAKQIGNQSDLYVTIKSPSRDANIAFGQALEDKLVDHPDLRFVLFHRERTFFDKHALLYADLGDLLELRRKVILRIREEVRREAFGGLSLLGDKEREKKDKEQLGLEKTEIEEKYGAAEDFKEYYEADEGQVVVARLRPSRPPTDVEFSRALQGKLHALIDEIDPKKFDPAMTVGLDGAYAQIDKRVRSFQREVVGGSLGSLAVLVLSLGFYFRSARSVIVVFVPLIGSVIGSLAFAAIAYGVLNLVSAFIFAILLGLGIDFAIVLLSRYRDERVRGLDRTRALEVMLSTTAPASLFGGASTALGFGVLAIADFQGFAQFGVVATVGVFAALASAMIVMPAMLVLMDRVRPWNPKQRHRRSARLRIDGAHPRWFALASLVLAAAVGWVVYSVAHARDIEFEYDFDKLGPQKAAGPEDIGYRDAVGRTRTVAPAVGFGELPQTEAMYRQLAALRKWVTPDPGKTVVDLAELAKPAPRAPWPMPTDEVEDDAPAQKDAPKQPAKDDDWDDEPAEGEDAPAEPAKRDAPPEAEEDFDDELDEFGDSDLDDPKFVALESSVVARPRVAPETLALLQRYDQKRLDLIADRLNDVTSLFAFVPEQQDEKLAVIADIRRRIDDKRGGLSAKTKQDIDEWYDYLKVDHAIGVADLPPWVLNQFTDAEGEVGRFVVVWTRGSKTDYRNVKNIHDAYASLETNDGPVTLAADFFVIPEVYGAIEQDGPRVMMLSFAVMLLTSIATFRALAAGVAAAVMVPFAIASLLGIMYTLGWKLDFFNVIALPLLVGMGEDSALHVIARYREEGRGRLALAVRETGGAIFMTAWTTICGFGAILSANHRGLQSLAWVSVVGVALVFFTAVLVLPALIVLTERLRPVPATPPAPPPPPAEPTDGE